MKPNRRGLFAGIAGVAVAGPDVAKKMMSGQIGATAYPSPSLNYAGDACAKEASSPRDYQGFQKAAKAMFGKRRVPDEYRERQRLDRLRSMSESAKDSIIRAKMNDARRDVFELRKKFGWDMDNILTVGDWWERF